MDDDCDKFVKKKTENEHIIARKYHYEKLQVDENLMNPETELANEILAKTTTDLVDDNMVNLATMHTNENLMNLATELVDDNETAIGVINAMVNPIINIFDVDFDEELLANNEKL